MIPILLAAFLAVAQAATTPVTAHPGSSIAVQIKKTVKADKAKVGDEVVAEVTVPVLQDGRIIIPKGARVAGRVTTAIAHTKEHPESVLAVRFDSAEWKGGSVALSAYIVRQLAVEVGRIKVIEDYQVNCIPVMRLLPQSGQTSAPPPPPPPPSRPPPVCDTTRPRLVPSPRPVPGPPKLEDVFVRTLNSGATELLSTKKTVTLPAGLNVELRQVAP